MYPYGSGTPPNYPNQNNPAYPSQNAPPFGGGYPPQPGSTPYPSQSYPNQPSGPFGGGFISSGLASQPSAYPPQNNPGYPPQAPNHSAQPSYPPQNNPGYPPQAQPSYPPHSSPGYPPQAPNHSAQPSYPPQSNSMYPPQVSSHAPHSQPSYPPQSNAGYPPQTHQAHYSPSSTDSCYPGQNPYPSHQATPYNNQNYPTIPNSTMPQHGGYSSSGCGPAIKKSKGNPTVVPSPTFDAVLDANAVRKAMKGFGTDEDAIINVICRRSNEQRQQIAKMYKTHFGKDLLEDIKSETSGNFENLLIALLTPTVEFYCKELYDAMSGLGTDEDVLIETLCTLSNYEIQTIKNAYQHIYHKNLESELMSETSGNFKRLLVSLCVGGRDESGQTDISLAQRDATELLQAGELRVGTDESTFNLILCQRNYDQLKLICEEYKKMTGHSLEKAIKKEFSGDVMDGLMAIVQCVSNKHEFFAHRLKKSMAGIGTNDRQLIRLIVSRCEIDLQDIKTVFERVHGKSLKSWIKGDTSGHYKHCLYALINEERS